MHRRPGSLQPRRSTAVSLDDGWGTSCPTGPCERWLPIEPDLLLHGGVSTVANLAREVKQESFGWRSGGGGGGGAGGGGGGREEAARRRGGLAGWLARSIDVAEEAAAEELLLGFI